MSGLNRNIMVAGLMAAMANPEIVGASRLIGLQPRRSDPLPTMNFVSDRGHRGKGRNKNPRRFTGVAASKRAAIKARNRKRK